MAHNINITYFRDNTALVSCVDEPGIILRLLAQLPEEFFKVNNTSVFMFDYNESKFNNIINEFFNPEVIEIIASQYNQEHYNYVR